MGVSKGFVGSVVLAVSVGACFNPDGPGNQRDDTHCVTTQIKECPAPAAELLKLGRYEEGKSTLPVRIEPSFPRKTCGTLVKANGEITVYVVADDPNVAASYRATLQAANCVAEPEHGTCGPTVDFSCSDGTGSLDALEKTGFYYFTWTPR